MIRYAEWRSPSAPLQSKTRFRWTWKAGLLGAYGVVCLGMIIRGLVIQQGSPFIFFFCSSGFISLLGSNREQPWDVLADDPAPIDQFRVYVQLKLAELTYGRDAGLVSFVDGWLIFEGRRTSFSIRHEDVDKFHSGQTGQLRLVWEAEGIRYLTEIRLAEEDPNRAKLFAIGGNEWKGSKILTDGQSVFPPNRPRNDLRQVLAKDAVLYVRTGWLALLVAAIFLYLSVRAGSLVAIIPMALLICAGVLLPLIGRHYRSPLEKFQSAVDEGPDAVKRLVAGEYIWY